ncbi:MAG TPA: hypothetical protein VMU34_19800 [Mycobacterium sp.]|nr:hypothetical protein [Mycobacterium sp.]
MGNVQNKAAARRAVREAHARAQEERARRERENIEDLAAFLVARDRLAAVDEWQAERVAGILAEAARRRDEHRVVAATAVCRIHERGGAVIDIARLTSVSEMEVRGYLKMRGARRGAEAAASADGG